MPKQYAREFRRAVCERGEHFSGWTGGGQPSPGSGLTPPRVCRPPYRSSNRSSTRSDSAIESPVTSRPN